MNKSLLLIPLIFLLIPNSVLAQPSLFQNWYEYLHIPRDYSTFPNILYFVIIPFLGTFAIIWGILTNLRLFKLYKVNVLLSLIFAFALLYTGALLAFVGFLFQFGAIFGVIAFFIVFTALTVLWTYRRSYEEYGETKKIYEKYKDVGKKREEISKKRVNLSKKLQDLNREMNQQINKRSALINLDRAIEAGVITNDLKNSYRNLVGKGWISASEARVEIARELRRVEDRITNLGEKTTDIDKELRELDEEQRKLTLQEEMK